MEDHFRVVVITCFNEKIRTNRLSYITDLFYVVMSIYGFETIYKVSQMRSNTSFMGVLEIFLKL